MSIMELHYQVSKTCGKVDQTEVKVDTLSKTMESYESKMDSWPDVPTLLETALTAA